MTGRNYYPDYTQIHYQKSKPKQNHQHHNYFISTMCCMFCGLPAKSHLTQHTPSIAMLNSLSLSPNKIKNNSRHELAKRLPVYGDKI